MASVLTTRGAEGMDRRAFSLDEIEAMLAAGILDPDEKFELIDGEIVPMSPQNMPHMLWRMRLGRVFDARAVADVEAIVEATLVLRDRPVTTFETDVLIFRTYPGQERIRPADVLLAIEVSDTTRLRDLNEKAPRYAAAGVAELWVVDLQEQVTRVHRAPADGVWASIEDVAFDRVIAPAFDPGIAVRLVDLA